MVPPQTLGVPPPPQIAGGVQVPQLSMPPQPSPIGPQLRPSAVHDVRGTHAAEQTPVVQVPEQGAQAIQFPDSSSEIVQWHFLVVHDEAA